jgi:hypothetical protein
MYVEKGMILYNWINGKDLINYGLRSIGGDLISLDIFEDRYFVIGSHGWN